MKIILISMLTLLASCSTEFVGEAHLTPKQCQEKCDSWGMQLDGMVAMGEYSDACICTKSKSIGKQSSAAGAGAIGVILQKRAEQQAANARTRSGF